jgi:enamine deaminase RidA (YjgF/YER057c/UK114 family)
MKRSQRRFAGAIRGLKLKKSSVGSDVPWEEEYGYSRAVRVGDRILVSGTTATGPDGVVTPGGAREQARFIVDKIEAAIRQLGGTLADVVRTRVYIRNLDDWKAVAEVHGERFGNVRPANTVVQAGLVGDEYLVEMEAEAIVCAGEGGT